MLVGILDDASSKLSRSGGYDLANQEAILYNSSGRLSSRSGRTVSVEPFGAGDTIAVRVDMGTKIATFLRNGRLVAEYPLKCDSVAPCALPDCLLSYVSSAHLPNLMNAPQTSACPAKYPIQLASATHSSPCHYPASQCASPFPRMSPPSSPVSLLVFRCLTCSCTELGVSTIAGLASGFLVCMVTAPEWRFLCGPVTHHLR